MPEAATSLIFVPAVVGLFSMLRYFAYLRLARYLSRVHGLAGLEALRFVARPGLSPEIPQHPSFIAGSPSSQPRELGPTRDERQGG